MHVEEKRSIYVPTPHFAEMCFVPAKEKKSNEIASTLCGSEIEVIVYQT